MPYVRPITIQVADPAAPDSRKLIAARRAASRRASRATSEALGSATYPNDLWSVFMEKGLVHCGSEALDVKSHGDGPDSDAPDLKPIVPTLRWMGDANGHLRLIDQTLLPVEFKEIDCRTVEEVW